ncbi:MAG TPA: hypothetical protein VML91_17455 [Burkholderiales bacterium]|nr:hypothetical protein [Burkholderiales bacterium]
MSFGSLLTRVWQAKVPIILGAAVVLLVIATLRANDQRECRQVCLKHRFTDGVYARERFGEGRCECLTDDGKLVPAPRLERR